MKKNEENQVQNIEPAFSHEARQFLEISGMKGITDNEKMMFLKLCELYHLNPFKREIYLSAYGSGDNRQLAIITGYEVYIKRAESTGMLDGWTVEISGEGPNMLSTITIHRKDWSKPFIHSVIFSEYVQNTKEGRPNKFWASKPRTMLKKVAISQGFRMAFPEILSGMPYTEDELPGEPITIEIPLEKAGNSPEIESKPELKPGSQEWDKAVKYLKNGGNINAIRTKYCVRDSERLLQEVADHS